MANPWRLEDSHMPDKVPREPIRPMEEKSVEANYDWIRTGK